MNHVADSALNGGAVISVTNPHGAHWLVLREACVWAGPSDRAASPHLDFHKVSCLLGTHPDLAPTPAQGSLDLSGSLGSSGSPIAVLLSPSAHQNPSEAPPTGSQEHLQLRGGLTLPLCGPPESWQWEIREGQWEYPAASSSARMEPGLGLCGC